MLNQLAFLNRGLSAAKAAVDTVTTDLAAAFERDPVARTTAPFAVVLLWPGLQVVASYRSANLLYRAGVPFVPQLISAVARTITGIEIHPAARIGAGFFIDHGSGVVIGETAEIGRNVTIYQGVTLGGAGFGGGKRHPTVEDNVTIGSGAKLLGPIRVGHGAKVGANSVVIHDVPANSTVVGNPGHPVRVDGKKVEGPDTDWLHLPDPVADAISGLAKRIDLLEQGKTKSPSTTTSQNTRLRAKVPAKPRSTPAIRRGKGHDPVSG